MSRELLSDEEEYMQALMAMDDDYFLDLLFPAFFAVFATLTLYLKRRIQRVDPPPVLIRDEDHRVIQ